MTVYDTPTDWKSRAWWRNRDYAERVFHAKVPPRHVTGPMRLALDSPIRKWAGDSKVGDSLLITGPSGSGKTYDAVQAMTAMMAREHLSGRFVNSDDYVEMIKDSFDSDGDMPEMYSTPYLLKYIKGVWDVLILDGLGQERQTEFAKHEIGSLLRHRHDHCLTTIITSTMNAAEIRNRYGDRVAGPITEMKQVTLARQ